MVFIKFEGFILALLLVSFALQNLSVHADYHHQDRRLLKVNSVKETQETDASFEKKLASGMGKRSKEAEFGGRKMGMMLKKEDGEIGSRLSTSTSTGDAQKLNAEADKNAAKEGPQDFLNNQGQENYTLESFSEEDVSDEWRKLLEEADKKVMQMMRKDYSGMRRPRRKPPINNHEPRN